MTNTAKQVAEMIDILPESDKQLAFEIIKKLVLAWDPDYTKVTPNEVADIEQAEKNYENGDYYTDDEINWN